MLSIVVSSHNKSFFNALTKNIEHTCGTVTEIIKIDNPGTMGLCKAYNKGALQASFPNILFLHEDVEFREKNWGQRLINHLNDAETGIIGLAGSSYVPVAPSGWFIAKQKNNSQKTKAFAVDGVFLAMRLKHFKEFSFNENVQGFHGYDLDISLRVAKKYNNYIVNDILIDHFSAGKPNQQWLDNNIQIRKNIGNTYQNVINSTLEKTAYINFVKAYFSYYKITSTNILKTFEFYPFTKIKLNDHFEILKMYYFLLKYRKMYHKKYKSI